MISPLFLMNPVALVSRTPSFFTAATPAQAVHDKESPLITTFRYLPKTKILIFQRFGNRDALGSFSIGCAK
jgi:hypothetical protein